MTEKNVDSCSVPVPRDILDNEKTSQEVNTNNPTASACQRTQDTPNLSGNRKLEDNVHKSEPTSNYNSLETERGQAVAALVSGEEVVSKTGGQLLDKNFSTDEKMVDSDAAEETSEL
jgi:hypothetical protein